MLSVKQPAQEKQVTRCASLPVALAPGNHNLLSQDFAKTHSLALNQIQLLGPYLYQYSENANTGHGRFLKLLEVKLGSGIVTIM